jgi:hypothetical protein
MSTSTKLFKLAADLEACDELHEARLLLLISDAGDKAPIDGIMKLAKMDFLLRYPNVLERALNEVSSQKPSATRLARRISEQDTQTIEGKMIRFRYGPWDKRYRRWLSVLVAKGLVVVRKERRTIKIEITDRGRSAAERISKRTEFQSLQERVEMVKFAVGAMPATRLKDFVYKIAPEILGMKWGEAIKI